MATVLTHATIAEAREAVETYVSTCNGIYEGLHGTLGGLTNSNWTGEGAEGCKYFYNNTASPVLTEGLTSIAKAMNDILTNVEETLLNQLDPQLGEANKDPGAQG